MENLKLNFQVGDSYGSSQKMVTKKLVGDRVSEVETRTYQTIWIEDRAYTQLIRVNDRCLSPSQKTEEAKRRADFIRAINTTALCGWRRELQSVPVVGHL